MSLVALPASVPIKRRIPWMLALVLAVCAVGTTSLVMAFRRGAGGAVVTGDFYHAMPMDMDVVINKDGELQAVNNVDIVSQVEGQSTILDIAKEGSFVHKGDVICRFDSSDIETKVETAQLDLQQAESDLTAAKENKAIQQSSNDANYEAAEVDLTLAKLDLQEYLEGTYPSDLQDAKTAVEMAKIDVKTKEDDLDQARSLFSKGFMMAADLKTAEVALLNSKNTLDQKTTALDVLQKYAHQKDTSSRQSTVAQAEKKLVRVQRENASNLAQKEADLQAKDRMLAIRKRQLDHLQEQLAACTIKAPQDGMVVYSSSISGSWGRRDTPIQPGAQVRWQELLIRLPDTSSMKAVCRINESQVAKLKVDPNNPLRATIKIIGQPRLLTGWLSNISIMADSSNKFWNPDSKEYPVDVKFDETPAGLKPGMSADEVKIYVDRLHNVLAVPVGAVYAAGKDNYVFVRDANDVKPVKVALGEVNETHAQIASGISQGQDVLILQAGQGRDLLERAGIKVEPQQQSSTTQPSKKTRPRSPGVADANDAGKAAKSEGEPKPNQTAAPAISTSAVASVSDEVDTSSTKSDTQSKAEHTKSKSDTSTGSKARQ